MKLINILVLAITISLCFSCKVLYKEALKDMGVFDTKSSYHKITNKDKEILFLPMHHIGKNEFYEDATHFLDSAVKEGYYVFFEGVGSTYKTMKELDTVLRKFRHLTGIDMLKMRKNGGYIDSTTNTFISDSKALNKIVKKDKLVNQPASLRRNKDSTIGKRVDGNYENIILEFENKYGMIKFNSYDLKTPLGGNYDKNKRQRLSKEKKKYLMQDVRNKIIVNEVMHSNHKKILMLYGKNHYEGILELLKKADSRFTVVQ